MCARYLVTGYCIKVDPVPGTGKPVTTMKPNHYQDRARLLDDFSIPKQGPPVKQVPSKFS
jgi:hypothetical protein